jgi:hypothetical protein
MIVGIVELGPSKYDVATRAFRFMLEGLQCTQNAVIKPGCAIALNMTRPPEVLIGDCPEDKRTSGACKHNTKFVGVNTNEETDGTFYIIASWGRVVTATGDTALEKDFYPTLKTYMEFYFAPDAKSSKGVPYWNSTLGLLWTPHLEHSRLTRMWAAYDSLTNSFAVEGIRYMLAALQKYEPENTALAAIWTAHRNAIIHIGLGTTLNYKGAETEGKPIYAEMLAHVDGPPNGDGVRDPDPLLFGMSWVQLAVINLMVSSLSNAGGTAPLTPVAQLGIDEERLENTFNAYAKSGSFLWLNEDESLSALVQTTNVNSSRLRDPPYRAPGPLPPAPTPAPPPPLQTCSAPLTGAAALKIAQGQDAWSGGMASFHLCCAKCTVVGPTVCNIWFYNGDTKQCYFKLNAQNDPVTKPSPNFYAGRLHNTPSPPPVAEEWCATVSWPFGGTCHPGCPCPARVTIGKAVGWETGWYAHKERWTRLIAMTRWLGAAHHIEKQPLFGEDLDYDCIKAAEQGKTVAPSNGRCWGDAGNGVQIGWWVWGQAVLRRKLGIL